MGEEIESIKDNVIWELVKFPSGVQSIGCKWIYKTKTDLQGKIERNKACLVAKGFTQKEGIGYKETSSLISSKDSFTVIMAMIAHFDLELHQMGMKTTFLNRNIVDAIYIVQSENFLSDNSKSMICKLKKFIHGFKQSLLSMVSQVS